jgi:uncharacterized membrane protein
MHVLEVLFGNGWLIIALPMAGILTSAINLPVHRTKDDIAIFVNVGGCALPVALSSYLVYAHQNMIFTVNFLVALVIVIAVSRAVSWHMDGVGVRVMFVFVVAAAVTLAHFLAATLLTRLVFAYVTGTFGVLVGADVVHLVFIGRNGYRGDKFSIGGAGIKDAVWVTGLAAAFLVGLLGL